MGLKGKRKPDSTAVGLTYIFAGLPGSRSNVDRTSTIIVPTFFSVLVFPALPHFVQFFGLVCAIWRYRIAWVTVPYLTKLAMQSISILWSMNLSVFYHVSICKDYLSWTHLSDSYSDFDLALETLTRNIQVWRWWRVLPLGSHRRLW